MWKHGPSSCPSRVVGAAPSPPQPQSTLGLSLMAKQQQQQKIFRLLFCLSLTCYQISQSGQPIVATFLTEASRMQLIFLRGGSPHTPISSSRRKRELTLSFLPKTMTFPRVCSFLNLHSTRFWPFSPGRVMLRRATVGLAAPGNGHKREAWCRDDVMTWCQLWVSGNTCNTNILW